MLYRFLWIFFVYAFLGWCTEVSCAALVTGTFVNRGVGRYARSFVPGGRAVGWFA